MGTIEFKGEEPFELALQQHPTTVSEGDIVVVTLPVFAPGMPQQTAQVRLVLSPESALYMMRQLQPAQKMAEIRSKQAR